MDNWNKRSTAAYEWILYTSPNSTTSLLDDSQQFPDIPNRKIKYQLRNTRISLRYALHIQLAFFVSLSAFWLLMQ